MSKIVCFGELMLRLAPEGYERFVQAKKLNVEFGGAEANVAVSLVNYGASCAFVTKLPQNQLGQAALNSLRRYGVDVSFVARGGRELSQADRRTPSCRRVSFPRNPNSQA